MPTTKKKKTTKTAAKRSVAAKTHRKAATRTCCKKCAKEVSGTEKMHIYIVTALGFVTAILLCANAAMMLVA